MSVPQFLAGAAAVLAALTVTGAHAALTTLGTFTGAGYGVSTSGCGSTTQTCTLNASVPAGATILKAFLYTSTDSPVFDAGGTFTGNAVSYTSLGVAAGFLQAGRADVTAWVSGGGGYTITETASAQDGSALVIVHDDPTSTAVRTVAVLDGFSEPAGDSATLNFSDPLDPAAPGFTAEMRLGIGYSANGNPCGRDFGDQSSRVTVNGTTITESAGCSDDSVDAFARDGNLITVGDDDDPFSPFLPLVTEDHERYNLAGLLNAGDTSINIRTLNPSNDDNIFLAVLMVSGEASVSTVSEPTGLALASLALGAAGWSARRRTRL